MTEIINWFAKNYPEDRSTISTILEDAKIKHKVTVQELKKGCAIIRREAAGTSKGSLKKHIAMLCLLSDKGVPPKVAGKHIQVAIREIRAKREARLNTKPTTGKVNLN